MKRIIGWQARRRSDRLPRHMYLVGWTDEEVTIGRARVWKLGPVTICRDADMHAVVEIQCAPLTGLPVRVSIEPPPGAVWVGDS